MVLDLPDVRQRDDHSCGRVAVECVLRHYGLTPARWLARLANPVMGMSPDTIEAVLWDALGHVLRGSMDAALLQSLTRSGRPVLCPVTVAGGGHWVVVRGVARGRVYYHCPTAGPASLRLPAWHEIWRDHGPAGAYHSFGVCGWPD